MDADGARTHLDTLLRTFGQEFGIPGLATEENGVCILMFDGNVPVNLMIDPASGNLFAWSTLGRLPETGADSALRTLMRANLFWRGTDGGTLGLMPDSDLVVFALQRPVDGMDVPLLQAVIETVVLRADEFRGVLQASEPAETDVIDANRFMTAGIRG